MRSNKEKILRTLRVADLDAVKKVTSAFDKEIDYLKGFWGCEQGIFFYSQLFEFFCIINAANDFDTKEDFLNQHYKSDSTPVLTQTFVNFDKAIPFVVTELKNQEEREFTLHISDLFIDGFGEVEFIEDDFSDEMANAIYDFTVLERMIPEYNGSSKNSLLSFIWTIDQIVRDTDPAAVEQLRNIAIVAKSKVKGSIRQHFTNIAGLPYEIFC